MNQATENQQPKVQTEELTEEGKQLFESIGNCMDKLNESIVGENVIVAVAALVELAMKVTTAQSTPPVVRQQIAGLFMQQAHQLSAMVSMELADSPAVETGRPQIITPAGV